MRHSGMDGTTMLKRKATRSQQPQGLGEQRLWVVKVFEQPDAVNAIERVFRQSGISCVSRDELGNAELFVVKVPHGQFEGMGARSSIVTSHPSAVRYMLVVPRPALISRHLAARFFPSIVHMSSK